MFGTLGRAQTGIIAPSPDTTHFGRATVYSGARLADALVRLRELARSGERSKSDVEAEIEQLIERSRS